VETVRIGIIGIGGMGANHARYLVAGEVPAAALTAVADTRPERLEWARGNLSEGVTRFATPRELIGSRLVDGVLIATPHYDHPPIAIEALRAGLHVLTEKPAGVYTAQVREMNAAATRSGKVFGIMFNQRTNPLYCKLRDLVQGGELGQIKRTNWIITNWYRSQSYFDSGGWRATWGGEGGGVLLNQDPHQLDLWQWIFGMPSRVRAFCYSGKWHNIEVEDDVTAFVEYPSGATGVFVTSTADAPGTNRLEIAADRGKVVVEDGLLRFWQLRVPERQFNRDYRGGFGEPECSKVDIPIEGDTPGHPGITADWVRAIRTGSKLLAPGEEGIKSLEISNAMYLSSWLDRSVDLPIDDELYRRELEKRVRGSTFRKPDGSTTMDVRTSFGT
jgi:predicted dehydrogenase